MNDILSALKKEITQKHIELEDITRKIEPYLQTKQLLEEEITLMERLVLLRDEKPDEAEVEDALTKNRQEADDADIFGRFYDRKPVDAYRELITKDFKGRTFTEPDLREIAIKEGLKTREGNLVTGSYGRSMLAALVEKGTIEKVDRGIYRERQIRRTRLRGRTEETGTEGD